MKSPGIKSQINSPELNDLAVSALTGVIIIIILVLIMTSVISLVFFSLIGGVPLQKNAYIVAEAKYSTKYGYPLVSLFNKAGDTGLFSGSGSGYPIEIQISAAGEIKTASPDTENLKWTPGTSLFIMRTDAGYTITDNPDGTNKTPLAFPGNEITVAVIDTANNILIFSQKVKTDSFGNFTTSTTTTTPTINATPTSTTTPTATATATISTNKIKILWSPATYGYASLSPPEPLVNSKQINIPTGSSQTVYFVPDDGRAVLTIKLDGAIVYSGSSTGSTIQYTVSDVAEDHILRATFG
ncbi:hypothetical protein Mpet_0891 [Methanolacinia petrolearia DSM 11571]|uniref:Archaeal Type IV pilin N-terminal domain-containing protein n=1 Tax=Methanolacinia petrolearia (strain DSM 11571 / OCM 486 / SEBR 4847) TaxID=679926 RepID=E1RJL2_METP4|nr:hypothetical protein [Methanolacinia petrolearia]ADN35659.1 hypothetical protein Mpet_0891 [Methanolacinia petrolearia DSM 11571]